MIITNNMVHVTHAQYYLGVMVYGKEQEKVRLRKESWNWWESGIWNFEERLQLTNQQICKLNGKMTSLHFILPTKEQHLFGNKIIKKVQDLLAHGSSCDSTNIFKVELQPSLVWLTGYRPSGPALQNMEEIFKSRPTMSQLHQWSITQGLPYPKHKNSLITITAVDFAWALANHSQGPSETEKSILQWKQRKDCVTSMWP